jgi:putative SOS response-associated peptidase YedK
MIAAGVWEEHDEHGLCYLMLTTTPNKDMAKVHDRMPVLLAPDQRNDYLSAEAPPQELVMPYKGQLEIFQCASPLTKDWKPGLPEPVGG